MIDQKEEVLIKVSSAVIKTKKNNLNHFEEEKVNFIKELVWSIIQRSLDKNSRRDPVDRNRRKNHG